VIEIQNGDLTGDLTHVVFGGIVDFTGAADISLALMVPPERLSSVSLRRTGIGPSVVEQLRLAGHPLDIGLHLSGFLSAPTLEPNAANALSLAVR
jgi:hypothetical protein